MVWIVREADVIYPRHLRVRAEELSYAPRIFDMTIDPKRNCLYTLEQQECAQWRQYRTCSPLINTAATCDIRCGAKVRGVYKTMVGRVGLAEHREPLGISLPRELSAINNDAAKGRSVTAHELGQ